IRSADSSGRRIIGFSIPDDEMRKRSIDTTIEADITGQTSLRDASYHWIVKSGGETWSIPSGREGFVDDACVAFSKTKSCVVLYGSTPGRQKIHCFDQNKKELWSTEIWGGNHIDFWTGQSFHKIEMQIHENRLAVFGYSDSYAYLELFDLRTGKD